MEENIELWGTAEGVSARIQLEVPPQATLQEALNKTEEYLRRLADAIRDRGEPSSVLPIWGSKR